MAAFDRLLVIGRTHHDPDLRIPRLNAQHGNPAAKFDALACDLTENDVCAFRIFAGERLRCLQHRHRRAEPAKGLRQLEADGATSNDDEMVGSRDQIEDRLVGEMRGSLKSRNCGSDGVDPVAITKRRALIWIPSPTSTVLRSLKRAAPRITRTPSPVKRSFESLGAIAAMTPCTCR